MMSAEELSNTPLSLTDTQRSFFKKTTGIESDDVLEAHVADIREKGFSIHPYPCIGSYNFLAFRASNHPKYSVALTLKEKANAIFLDQGCCFGTDIRKAVFDGWSPSNVIGSDLRPEFIKLGHDLFRDARTCPIKFITGDFFDSQFLTIPLPEDQQVASTQLSDVQTLNELRSRCTVIHASAFFHLFRDEAVQATIAHRLGSLLSQEPGSMIFGGQYGGTDEGITTRFIHTERSFGDLWNGNVFQKDSVTYWSRLVPISKWAGQSRDGYWLLWAVVRN